MAFLNQWPSSDLLSSPPLSPLGHCHPIVHIRHTATRLQPRIGTVPRTRCFHMTLALSLTGNCQLPCWLNMPPDCAFLNSTWPWHLSEQLGTLYDGTGLIVNIHFPAVYHPGGGQGGALPPLGSKLKIPSPVSRYGPDQSQTPPWSYAQPASRVLAQMTKDWLSLSSGRPACLRPSVFPGTSTALDGVGGSSWVREEIEKRLYILASFLPLYRSCSKPVAQTVIATADLDLTNKFSLWFFFLTIPCICFQLLP